MGLVTAVLPLFWALAKPLFGYLVDYWPNHRKLVFMLLITVMTGSYCGLWFIPMPEEPPEPNPGYLEYVYRLNDTVYIKRNPTSGIQTNPSYDISNSELEKYKCHWSCTNETSFEVYLSNDTYVNTIYVDNVDNTTCSFLHMDFDDTREGEIICIPKQSCNLLCFEDDGLNVTNYLNNTRLKRGIDSKDVTNQLKNDAKEEKRTNDTKVLEQSGGDSFYMTAAFWSFVVLMCVGTIAFNVANCIGDAVCFDVL
ncbi:uncharacterized protein LOC113238733, partial [Hyposmocoma kahamanoa]|uniref:uncharacterized protein LOC113238733 n=1 Tax=Hyposmocoma kahamanoa TaxID=1477025 RepID=UPI000E6D657F